MLFVDICGSTRLYEQEGDVAARRRIRQMLDALGEAAAVRGGQVLKEIGGELLIVFEQMPALLSFVQVLPAIQDAQAMRCKTGIHLGSVIVERGDVFGGAVNTAARIVSLAGPGQVLLSRDALEGLSVPERPEVRALPRWPCAACPTCSSSWTKRGITPKPLMPVPSMHYARRFPVCFC